MQILLTLTVVWGTIMTIAIVQDRNWVKKYGKATLDSKIDDSGIYSKVEPYNRYEDNDYR